ncbi:MAG: ACT domain-containing protein, partial [Candidatus Neomarinimicrobiota bacterium]
RFLILAHEPFTGKGEKCSIIFSTAHKAGTLFKVLEIFAKAKINLTRIESVPKSPGQYAFFLDFIGSKDDPKVEKVLEEVAQSTSDFRLMGCYLERILA